MDIKPNLQMLQPQTPQSTTPVQNHNTAEAPPKQVAQAMDKLSQASRLIAEIRIGADRFLEGLFAAAQPHSSNKPLQLFLKEDATMRQNLQELRSLGRQLEETGVLTDSLRSRSNSWGLHMPLVCPDGAVVAYAWKRQLAGQAGASAVDRTRLALKAFADQKRQFFPHLDDGQSTEPTLKKHHSSQVLPSSHQDESSICKTLSDVLACLEKEMPNLRVHTYERLDWIKRAFSLSTPANENPVETLKEPTYHGLNKLRTGSQVAVGPSKVAVIELLCPSIFRAVVSLHPAGSIDPDAVAFFSPDEGGSHMHARGFSVYHVYKQITEHANMALQHFLGVDSEIALYSLLKWIYSYQTLFTKVCSKCKKLLAMDRNSLLLLPPVLRPYRQLYMMIGLSTQSNSSIKDHDIDGLGAYHVGCLPEKSLPHK